MAQAKQTTLQTVLQLAAGGTAFAALYYSLYGRQLSDTSIDKGSLTEKEKDSAKQWAALERETQNTTAQAWGLPGPPTPARIHPRMALPTNKTMYLHRLGDLVRIQLFQNAKPDRDMLTIELTSGTCSLSTSSKALNEERGAEKILGVFGLQKLVNGYALALITGVKQIASLQDQHIYRVTDSIILAPQAQSQDDERYVGLLRYAVHPAGAGKGLFFSYGLDLTRTQQRRSDTKTNIDLPKADDRFFFNQTLAQPLIDTRNPQIERFVQPVIMGSVQQIPSVMFGNNTYATITLVARRSTERPGVRHWRRGADASGVVANFVETEQIIEITTNKAKYVSAFVQIRGSIPLLWSQIPNIKYKPTTRVAPASTYRPAFDKHFTELITLYKGVQGVVAINLVNQHGSEGVLANAFQEEYKRFAAAKQELRLIPFDFHKVCGATRYDKLSLLWAQIRDDFQKYGFFLSGDGVNERQAGVFRTNCIDCLDRTNVVQGVLARKHLEGVLQKLRLLSDSENLPQRYPKVETYFRIMWAEHGDDISFQYAGTGALKSGFTRTGVRTKSGLVDDGVKSAKRYYLNNFQDGHKQDAIDLVTGNYVVSKDKPSPFGVDPNPFLPMFVALAALLYGSRNFLVFLFGGFRAATLRSFSLGIALPFAVTATVLFLIVKFGKKLVNKPQLRPDLAQPW